MAEQRFIPSQTWFPTSLIARAAWFANFNTQFAAYAAVLTLSSYVTAVGQDNEDFQSIAATRLAAKNFVSAVADFLKNLTESAVGSPHPVFPLESFAAPPNDVAAGIFQRLIELRELIMAQPTYTSEMGAAMGIEPATDEPLSPGDVQPEIELSAAAHFYLFSAVVTGREEADQWQVWVRPEGGGDWQMVATATGKSVDVTYNAGEASGPVQLQVYVQLRKNNANYGQPSEIGLVTVNP